MLTVFGLYLLDGRPDAAALARRIDALEATEAGATTAGKLSAEKLAALDAAGASAADERKGLSEKLAALEF